MANSRSVHWRTYKDGLWVAEAWWDGRPSVGSRIAFGPTEDLALEALKLILPTAPTIPHRLE